MARIRNAVGKEFATNFTNFSNFNIYKFVKFVKFVARILVGGESVVAPAEGEGAQGEEVIDLEEAAGGLEEVGRGLG